jgi:hypothetical protein
MKGLPVAAALAATTLAGCLVSEEPLFDAGNAAATPLAAGRYEACSRSDDGEAPECHPVTVELSKDGLYTFLVEDDRIEARMTSIGAEDYAVQLVDYGERDAQYYWARAAQGSFSLAMIWCPDLPKALVDRLIADGAVVADDDRSTCTARSAAAVILAAKAYAGGEASGDDDVVTLRPSAAQ